MGKRSGYCEERRRRAPKGMTLIELAIVLVIVSIVAVAGVPMVGPLVSQAKLAGAAEEVVTALEYAQLIAMTSGRKTRVVIGASADKIGVRQYEVSGDLFGSGDHLSEGAVEGGSYEFMQYPMKRGSNYEIFLNSEDRFAGVDITQSDFDNATPVYFDAVGSPSHGGTVTLALGNSQKVVSLDAFTGKVTVSD
jgi:prepilin-type N-terminal cleavage/methylation domain-containing protein